MEPKITFQPIEVLTDCGDHDGRLVLVDGRLAAVLVRLGNPAHEPHLIGAWYLETGFPAVLEMRHDLFATLEEAAGAIAAALAVGPDGAPKPGATRFT